MGLVALLRVCGRVVVDLDGTPVVGLAVPDGDGSSGERESDDEERSDAGGGGA